MLPCFFKLRHRFRLLALLLQFDVVLAYYLFGVAQNQRRHFGRNPKIKEVASKAPEQFGGPMFADAQRPGGEDADTARRTVRNPRWLPETPRSRAGAEVAKVVRKELWQIEWTGWGKPVPNAGRGLSLHSQFACHGCMV